MLVRVSTNVFSARESWSRAMIAALALCSFSGELLAGQVNLAWDPSPSTTVTGYKVYYGRTSGSYSASVSVGKVTSYTLSGLTDGTTTYIAVAAYDSTGAQSAYSNQISATIPGVAPAATPTPAPIATATPKPVATPVPVATATPSPAASCPCTIWPNTAAPATASASDTGAVELGVKFRSDVAGTITGIRFYKGAGNTGTHVGHLWNAAGTLLATATFSGETATGWQQVNFASPVAINANTVYVASYFAPKGGYAQNSGYFATQGFDNAPLHALQNGVSGANSVYLYGAAGGFPTNTWNSTNYWVDVVFKTTPAATPVPTTLPDFTVSAASLAVNQIETLTPATKTAVASWAWNYGDGSAAVTGTNSVIPVATKSYSKAGTYNVSLTVNGVTKTSAIKVSPIASFSATPTTGVAPLAVTLKDTSAGTPTAWAWTFGDGTTSTVQNPPAHSYATAGTYTVSLVVSGGGITSSTIAQQTITVTAGTVSATPPPSATATGLVAAYGFDEVSGATVADASGLGNHGTIKEAVSVSNGHNGRAMRFDGINDWITVNDSASLDLSTGMTMEAWVYPTVAMNGWRTIMVKEDVGNSVYYLYANTDTNQPLAGERIGAYQTVSGALQLPSNQWTHLAETYDGQYNRLYVNGVQVAQQAQTGTIPASGGVLRIGGNSVWGEYFTGYIDEVRLFKRARTAAEVKQDMATAVSVSNPPQFIVGDSAIEPVLDYFDPQGMAYAFKATPTKTGVVTNVQVYLDASSMAKGLVAGVYKDNLGHPGALIAQGSLGTLTNGAWNTVAIPVASVTAGQPYWIAILGTNGQLRFRDRVGSGTTPLETSLNSGLTSLPTTWATGSVYTDAPISAQGKGY